MTPDDGADIPETQPTDTPRLVVSAWRVSAASVLCTLIASSAAVAIGLTRQSIALIAFGAIGLADAIGSAALAFHFRYGMAHAELLEDFEKLVHRIVGFGLVAVGAGAVAFSAARLLTGDVGDGSTAGVVLASLSLVSFAALATRKRWIAHQLPSAALLADSHLSAIGAMQAAVVLAGIVAASELGWGWVDAVAAFTIGVLAIALGIATLRDSNPAD